MRLIARAASAAVFALLVVATVGLGSPAAAQVTPGPVEPGQPVQTIPATNANPSAPDTPAAPGAPDASISLSLPDTGQPPSQSVLIILLLTVLAVAPALLIMLTSFTRIVIVLSLTRNALGLQGIPPNQVIVGLALFLSIFVMGPTLSQMNEDALQPLLEGKIETSEAYDRAVVPLRGFMMGQVGDEELELFVSAQTDERPGGPEDVAMTSLVPAFILSELKTAFIIGFIVFIPFLVIDIVVSSSLMSMGMMMLPPILVSLPFKLLLFVMVDGWGLVVHSLLESFSV